MEQHLVQWSDWLINALVFVATAGAAWFASQLQRVKSLSPWARIAVAGVTALVVALVLIALIT